MSKLIDLTPLEAKRVVEYINNHPNVYICLKEIPGLGVGYHLTISVDGKDKKEITDYDAF